MKTVLETLNLETQTQIIVINAPSRFEPAPAELTVIKTLRDLKQVKRNAVLWFAYPKQTSKKYKCEFNRDTS